MESVADEDIMLTTQVHHNHVNVTSKHEYISTAPSKVMPLLAANSSSAAPTSLSCDRWQPSCHLDRDSSERASGAAS
eukprot:756319-Hanusia_phi.AAC.4